MLISIKGRGMEIKLSNETNFNHLPDVIRTIRKYSGLKQAEIAEKLNVNQSTYSKIERGLVSTSAEKWLMFAHILGLNFDAPLTGFIEVHATDHENFKSTKYMPVKYVKSNCLSSRLFFQIINILFREGHSEKITAYFDEHGIDLDYFRINNNYIDSILAEEILNLVGEIKNPFYLCNKIKSKNLEVLIGKEHLQTKDSFEFLKELTHDQQVFGSLIEVNYSSDDHSSASLILSAPLTDVGILVKEFLLSSIKTIIADKFKNTELVEEVTCSTLTKLTFKKCTKLKS